MESDMKLENLFNASVCTKPHAYKRCGEGDLTTATDDQITGFERNNQHDLGVIQGIRDNTLKTLSIGYGAPSREGDTSDSCMTSDRMHEIIEALRTNTSITSIDFTAFRMLPETASLFADILLNTKITKVSFSFSEIPFSSILKILQKEDLTFFRATSSHAENSENEQTMQDFCEAVQKNPSLQHVYYDGIVTSAALDLLAKSLSLIDAQLYVGPLTAAQLESLNRTLEPNYRALQEKLAQNREAHLQQNYRALQEKLAQNREAHLQQIYDFFETESRSNIISAARSEFSALLEQCDPRPVTVQTNVPERCDIIVNTRPIPNALVLEEAVVHLVGE